MTQADLEAVAALPPVVSVAPRQTVEMTVSVVGIVLNNAPESAPITGTRHTNRTTPTANGRRVAAAPGRFGRRAPQAVPDPNGSSPPSGKLDLADIRRQADAMRAPVRPSSGDGEG